MVSSSLWGGGRGGGEGNGGELASTISTGTVSPEAELSKTRPRGEEDEAEVSMCLGVCAVEVSSGSPMDPFSYTLSMCGEVAT